jgi:hypothetical protein
MKKPKNKDTKQYQLWELRNTRKKAFRAWSSVVRKRAGNVCEFCGSKEKLQSHHIEDFRLCSALRYDPRNGICCCVAQHKFRRDSAHHSFILMYDYLTKNRPDDINYLRSRCEERIEFTKEDLIIIITSLDDEVKGGAKK